MKGINRDSWLAQTILTQNERVVLHKIDKAADIPVVGGMLTTLLYDEKRQSERHLARQKLIDTTPSYVFERIGLVV